MAGVEPASKNKFKTNSTCLVIFNLTQLVKNDQTYQLSQSVSFSSAYRHQRHQFDFYVDRYLLVEEANRIVAALY